MTLCGLTLVWPSDSVLVLINEVHLRWARLVLGWVAMSMVQLPMQWKIYLSL